LPVANARPATPVRIAPTRVSHEGGHSLTRITGSRKRLLRRSLTAISAAFLLAVGAIHPALANLPGSNFESNDGNLVVDTPGNQDWANAPNRVVMLDNPSGTSDNSFGQGAKEDIPNPTVVSGSIPPNKSDLSRFYVSHENAGSNFFLYLAWERTNVLGSANMDFEFNQSQTLDANGVTPVRTAGDMLITFDFTKGGGTPVLGLLRWVTSGPTSQCEANNALPCWGNRVDLSAAGFADGAVNTVSVTDPIPPDAPRTLPALTFGEAAINLTAANVFPPGQCVNFASAFLKSRSSASFNAELKDFIAPANASISNCGKIVIKKVTDPSPDPTNTSFPFTLSGPNPPNTSLPKSFSLTNGESEETQVFVGSGYNASETVPANWQLVSATCDDGSPVTNIDVSADETVTCTFTNQLLLGAIKVHKVSSKDSSDLSGATFEVRDSGDNVVATLSTGSDGTACTDNLPFGSYTVTETAAPSGYKIDNPDPVSVSIDHNASCTSGTPNAPADFTDTPLSRITVSFESLAAGDPTSATVECTGDASAQPLPEGSPRTLDNLVPGTYSCTVVIDP